MRRSKEGLNVEELKVEETGLLQGLNVEEWACCGRQVWTQVAGWTSLGPIQVGLVAERRSRSAARGPEG